MHLRVLILAALVSWACGCTSAAPSTPPPPTATRDATSPGPGAPETKPAAVTVLSGATLIDGAGGPAVKDAVVILKGDRITYAGPRANAPAIPSGPGVRRLELAGRFLTPGLIDAHVHFFQSGGIFTRPDILDLRALRPYSREYALIRERLDSTLRRTLAAGVTAEVDAGGPMWNFAVRTRTRKALGPRIAVAGPLVSTVARPQFDPMDLPIRKVATPDEAEAEVRRQLASHPDLIKVWYIVDPRTGIEPPLPILRRVIEVSHKAGVRVMVHATQLEAARKAVELGTDLLAHSVDDAPVDPAFVALLKKRGTILIPTLVVYAGYGNILGLTPRPTMMDRKYGEPAILAEWRELASITGGVSATSRRRIAAFKTRAPIMAANLMALVRGGVRIAAGTDAGNMGTLHGTSLHEELRLMVAAGMTPAEVIVSATANAALVFSAKPAFGTITAGRLADMLVLTADPLKDIGALAHPERIILGGRVMTPAQIQQPNPEWAAQAQLDAYNARDLEAFLALYDPDVEIRDLPTGKLLMKGRSAMRRRYGALFKNTPKLHCRLVSRMVSGAFVTDSELVTGMQKPEVRATAIYRVEKGLIRNVWFVRH